METRQRESLRATGDKSAGEDLEAEPRNCGKPQGRQKRRVEIAGEEVETLLGADPPNPKEAWRRLKGWYKAAVNRAPPPARATLERIAAEQVDLYSYVPSPG